MKKQTQNPSLVKAAHVSPGKAVMVRSPSGDIDIMVLFLGHDFDEVRVLVDNWTGKIIDISSSTLPKVQRQALVGIHAFSGNDYVSSFFRKRKIAFWKAMLKRTEFIELFAGFGMDGELSDNTLLNLEKFVCFLYGDQRNRSSKSSSLQSLCTENPKRWKSR